MSERSRTTRTEDLVTMGAVTWMIVGLFVDADFHSTDPTLDRSGHRGMRSSTRGSR